MSAFFARIVALVKAGDVLITRHGYHRLAKEGITVEDILGGIEQGIVVEEYPTYYKGPCVLVLQKDKQGKPIHVVWGIPKHANGPAVVVTAYRPDPTRWDASFRRRKK